MSERVLYSEKIFSLGIVIILLIVTGLMTTMLVWQLIYGPIGTKPAPTWILAAFTILFILTTINFAFIKITLTDEGLSVYYGLFGTSRSWSDIVMCEEDEKNYFYGWGIRLGRYKKQWVWVYNAIGIKRVVFITNKSKPRGLIISTRDPQKLLSIAREKVS